MHSESQWRSVVVDDDDLDTSRSPGNPGNGGRREEYFSPCRDTKVLHDVHFRNPRLNQTDLGEIGDQGEIHELVGISERFEGAHSDASPQHLATGLFDLLRGLVQQLHVTLSDMLIDGMSTEGIFVLD